MRVRFVGTEGLEAREKQGATSLALGQEYVALEVVSGYRSGTAFRLEHSAHEGPALFGSKLFTITSGLMPPSWRYVQLPSGSFLLSPESWQETGFGEAYYDREPWAEARYDSEKRRIMEASWSPCAREKKR